MEWNCLPFFLSLVNLIWRGVEDMSIHKMPALAQGDELQKKKGAAEVKGL